MIFRKGELGSGVSVESLEDLVDLAADDLFNVLAGWCVVGSVGKSGDDRVLDVADVAGGLESGESRGLVVVSKWALSSSSSKSLGRHSSGSLDEGHLSSSTVSDSGKSIDHSGLNIDHVGLVKTNVGFLCLDLSSGFAIIKRGWGGRSIRRAIKSVTEESSSAVALESANRVGALGINVAAVGLSEALVNVLASDTVTLEVVKVVESSSASAGERTSGVGALGIGVAVVGADGALVDINAGLAISDESGVASAGETSDGVDASGVLVAVVLHGGALVDINAILAVSSESCVTGADETAIDISAGGVGAASIIGSTLIDVGAGLAVAEPSFVAFAGKSTGRVHAGSIGIAVVSSSGALVNIVASESITREAGGAIAAEGAFSVGADCSGITWVGIALIVIDTLSVNRDESSSAVASEASRQVHASFSSSVASVRSSSALVDIKADLSVSRESFVAGASETAVGVFAGSFIGASVSSSGALVNVDAVAFGVLGEAFVAAAGESTGEVGAVVASAG